MQCKICGNDEIKIEYEEYIRNGRVGIYTKEKVKLLRCKACGMIWHNERKNQRNFYESDAYRESLEGTADIHEFYRTHDGESFDKSIYIGTDLFRDKIVVDIGCGGADFWII